jgi:hypothetical protein
MLRGDVFYYDTRTGKRLAGFDSDATESDARSGSRKHVLAEFTVKNGPRETRYYLNGRRIAESHPAIAAVFRP